jgi:hypothetical protein
MSLLLPPNPLHYPPRQQEWCWNGNLGEFGMCNGPCGNHKISARLCRLGRRHADLGLMTYGDAYGFVGPIPDSEARSFALAYITGWFFVLAIAFLSAQ